MWNDGPLDKGQRSSGKAKRIFGCLQRFENVADYDARKSVPDFAETLKAHCVGNVRRGDAPRSAEEQKKGSRKKPSDCH